jgi:hypothetical protein
MSPLILVDQNSRRADIPMDTRRSLLSRLLQSTEYLRSIEQDLTLFQWLIETV